MLVRGEASCNSELSFKEHPLNMKVEKEESINEGTSDRVEFVIKLYHWLAKCHVTY